MQKYKKKYTTKISIDFNANKKMDNYIIHSNGTIIYKKANDPIYTYGEIYKKINIFS